MQVSISTNFSDVAKKIKDIGRQAEYAAAVALTKTAGEVREELKSEMRRVFDRPTPFTLNSLRVKSASVAKPVAYVWLKDEAGKGTPADRYLGPQITGGSRALKGMEKALQSSGLMQRGQFAVPSAGALLDGYGNVKRSQIVQILSQLRAQRGSGFESRKSESKASKRSVKKQGVTYFAISNQNNRAKLTPGIYLKKIFGHGSAIKPVFLFVPSLQYKPRFKFFEVAAEVVERRLPQIFDEELKKAIDTAFNKP